MGEKLFRLNDFILTIIYEVQLLELVLLSHLTPTYSIFEVHKLLVEVLIAKYYV